MTDWNNPNIRVKASIGQFRTITITAQAPDFTLNRYLWNPVVVLNGPKVKVKSLKGQFRTIPALATSASHFALKRYLHNQNTKCNSPKVKVKGPKLQFRTPRSPDPHFMKITMSQHLNQYFRTQYRWTGMFPTTKRRAPKVNLGKFCSPYCRNVE